MDVLFNFLTEITDDEKKIKKKELLEFAKKVELQEKNYYYEILKK